MISRGDVVVIAQRGVYEGKPRPAVVIQADSLREHPSILVCLIVGAEDARSAPFRVLVEPTSANGLTKTSLVEADRIATIKRENVQQVIGELEDSSIARLNIALGGVMNLR